MSKRSVKKRRHRDDFQGYMHQRAVNKAAGRHVSVPLNAHPHVHGPNCHHERSEADIQAAVAEAESTGAYEAVEHQTSLLPIWEEEELPQEVADKMTDEEWLNEKRLTAEEKAAIDSADNGEGEAF